MSEQSIYDKSLVIRNETQEYANTRGRVADVLDDINLTKANKTDVDNAIQIILDELGLTEAELYSYIDAQNQLQDIEIGKKVDKPAETVGNIKYILSNIEGVISWKPIEVTENYIPKFDGETFQNSALFQDVNGNIGIGNITPENKLHVTGYIQAEAYVYEATTENSIPNKSFTDGVDLFFTDENGITRKHLFTDSLPGYTQHGPITTTPNSVTIGLSELGENFAMIAGIKYIEPTTNPETPKPFTAVTTGNKVLIIEARPDAQVFYLVEGPEDAVITDPPYTGLLVARVIVTPTGVIIQEEDSTNKKKSDDTIAPIILNNDIPTWVFGDRTNYDITATGLVTAPILAGFKYADSSPAIWNGKKSIIRNRTGFPLLLKKVTPPADALIYFPFKQDYTIADGKDAQVIYDNNNEVALIEIGGGAELPPGTDGQIYEIDNSLPEKIKPSDRLTTAESKLTTEKNRNDAQDLAITALQTQHYKTISGNVTIDDTYYNCIWNITANAIITIPSTLRADFIAGFEVIGSFAGTFTEGSGVTFSAPFGKVCTADSSGIIYKNGSATYRLKTT